jgi:hypothetical protein
MKRTFLLCAMISAAVAMGGCANQTDPAANTAQARANARGGLVDPGSVAPVSAGPTHGVERQRFQP